MSDLNTPYETMKSCNETIAEILKQPAAAKPNWYSHQTLYSSLSLFATALFDYGQNIPNPEMAPVKIISAFMDNGDLLLRMPQPLRRRARQSPYQDGRYAFRSELRSVLSEIRIPSPMSDTNALTMLFVLSPSTPSCRRIDHDNYYVKPIIDSICSACGIDDSGEHLALAMYSTAEDSTLEPGFYAILRSGEECPPKAAAIALCKRHFSKNG